MSPKHLTLLPKLFSSYCHLTWPAPPAAQSHHQAAKREITLDTHRCPYRRRSVLINGLGENNGNRRKQFTFSAARATLLTRRGTLPACNKKLGEPVRREQSVKIILQLEPLKNNFLFPFFVRYYSEHIGLKNIVKMPKITVNEACILMSSLSHSRESNQRST